MASKAQQAEKKASKALAAFQSIIDGLTEAGNLYEQHADETFVRAGELRDAADRAAEEAVTAEMEASQAHSVAARVSELLNG